jgi:DNA-binding NtrC family response regulator
VSSPRRATVLVLEDNAAVQELIDQALRDPGHRVLSTNNPLEALEVVRRVHVDVLVTGVVLDDRKETLVHELLSIQAGLRIVSIRGSGDDPDADGRSSLSSPISLDELREVVATNLRI